METLAAATMAALLAHQGGWDEILLVLVPVAVVAWLLWLAKRRVGRTTAGDETGPAPAPGADSHGDD